MAGVDQLVGFDVRRRRQAERDGFAEAGSAAAEADRDHGAQIGIGERAHQHIDARRHEGLDDRASPFSSGRLHPPFELAPAGSDRRLALQSEQHGVDLARTRGRGKVRLQCHRSADFQRHRERALELAASMRGRNRDSVRGQQSLRVSE